MTIDIITPNMPQNIRMSNFPSARKQVTYGHINMPKKNPENSITTKDKLKAAIGSISGVLIPLSIFMRKQHTKNPFKVKYKVKEMLTMAACGNTGGILLSSVGEPKEDKLKKWKEGAFQMTLTSIPMLLVDNIIALCEKSKNPRINNNLTKITGSVAGVAIGSNTAIYIFNKLRGGKDVKKPERELKLIDMIANLDDAVAVCVLAKIPFADKIHIERALPFIYSFCGYRSGTGENRY